MKVIVTGLVGQYPLGGVVWDYMQYVLGFRALGHEVWYLEDSEMWTYDPLAETYTVDCTSNLRALRPIMEEFGLADHWIYRNGANGQFFGKTEPEARSILAQADLVANVSGAAIHSDYDLGAAHLMYLDGDPMFTQLMILDPKTPKIAERIQRHHSHFTFGLALGQSDCLVPTAGIDWKPTVQPIALDYWPVQTAPPLYDYTTVMSWYSYPPREWKGQTFGQKDLAFANYWELPLRCGKTFALAMGHGQTHQRPTQKLQASGWTILEPDQVVPDFHSYRRFLSSSRAEWSIAKHGYVQSKSGWFSGRTACYLASGRPAVVQDTGWSRYLPSGDGLLSFQSLEECLQQIARLESDYPHHCRSARRLAEEYFSADKVCAQLLSSAGVS